MMDATIDNNNNNNDKNPRKASSLPPPSSDQLSFGSEANLASFDRLKSMVDALAEQQQSQDNHKIVASLAWHGKVDLNDVDQRGDDNNTVIPINSLLFHATTITTTTDLVTTTSTTTTTTTEPIVAVVPSTRKVNVALLEEHLLKKQQEEKEQQDNDEQVKKSTATTKTTIQCSLVPAEDVEAVCGFAPGSVPPLGHHSPPCNNYNSSNNDEDEINHTKSLTILVDQSLVDMSGKEPNNSDNKEKIIRLMGGGGNPQVACLISSHTLLNHVEGTEVAHLTTATTEITNAVTTISMPGNDSLLPLPTTQQQTRAPKPYFPWTPPQTEAVVQILQKRQEQAADQQSLYNHNQTSQQILQQPLHLSMVGRINGIRRMAKKLVFVDLAPPDYYSDGQRIKTSDDMYDLPWRSAVDGQDMAVQLICGKTFCALVNDDEKAAAAMKAFKVGQLIWVDGKTNLHDNRLYQRHWVEKRSLDIIVVDYRLLEEAPDWTARIIGDNSDRARDKESKGRNAVSLPQTAQQPSLPMTTSTTTTTQQISRAVTSVGSSQQDNYLQLSEVLPQNISTTINVVDKTQGIDEFHQILQMLLKGIGGDTAPVVVGLDCEWKPNFMLASPAEPQPVLLLQISFNHLGTVYLFDLQAFLRPCQSPLEPTNPIETAVSEALSKLFGSTRFVKTGFQLMNDLQKLAMSYPHIPAFRNITGVVDVATVSRKALQIARIRNSKQITSSLNRLATWFLKKPLNKDQQISDWSCRPLNAAQMAYASLDAAVVTVLLEKSLELVDASWMLDDDKAEPMIGRYQDDKSFLRSVAAIRFLTLENNDSSTMRKLKAKKIVSNQWLVTQTWIAGDSTPSPPSPPAEGDESYVDVAGTRRVPARRLKIGENHHKDDTAHRIVAELVGSRVGKSKDSCLEALLKSNVNFPLDAKLEYDQRAGLVEFDNGVALFVNSPVRLGEPSRGRYPNYWLDEGRYMTFFLRKTEWNDGSSILAEKLLRDGEEEGQVPAVLFVRTKSHFLCCGRCRVNQLPRGEEDAGTKKDWGLEELRLQLLDWDKLQGVHDFASMAFSLDTALVPKSEAISSSDEDADEARESASSAQDLARLVMNGDLERAKALADEILSLKRK